MTVLTTVGAARIAAATAETPLVIDRMAIGDGNGAPITPVVGMTALVNERARVSVIDKVVNDNVVRIRALFTPGATAYTLREAGLIAENGDLIAVISLPPQEIPTSAWATANSQVVEVVVTIALVVSDAGIVTVNVDTSTVYATVEYVNSKVPPFATVDETRAGSTAVKIVHPVAYKAVLDEHKASRTQHPTGSETLQGFMRLATMAETQAGLLNSVGVHPAGLKAVIDALKNGVSSQGDTLKELYDLIIALQGVDTNILTILNSVASFANMPIYPEIRDPAAPVEDLAGYRIQPIQSGATITIPTGKFIIHRGGKLYSTSDFSLANRQFTITGGTQKYHLRWYAPGHTNAPVNTWPNGRFMLQSFGNPAYWAIGGNVETNVYYDSNYDDMLVATVQAVDLPTNLTITPLINKASHLFRRQGGGSPNNGPTKRTDVETINLARTPKVILAPWKFSQAPLDGATNTSELETDWVNRYAFQVSYDLKGANWAYWNAFAAMGDHHYDPLAAVA